MKVKRDNIDGLEGYFISRAGKLWSRYHKSGRLTKDSWHRIKSNRNQRGYKFVQKKGKCWYLHRLVAIAYIPNPHNKAYVCHKDNIVTHNHVNNLYWGTPSENTQQCIKEGRGYIGERNPNAKLSNKDREAIKRKFNKGYTLNQLSNQYSVSRSAIRRILNLSF